jgi:hypothetical protein
MNRYKKEGIIFDHLLHHSIITIKKYIFTLSKITTEKVYIYNSIDNYEVRMNGKRITGIPQITRTGTQ